MKKGHKNDAGRLDRELPHLAERPVKGATLEQKQKKVIMLGRVFVYTLYLIFVLIRV